MKRLLITGAGGQLASALAQCAGNHFEIHSFGRATLDISDAGATRAAIAATGADCVINAAAYTAVDKAESEPQQAHAVNRNGAAHVAAACAEVGARLIHVSTDFVFDGARNTPYQPDDPVAPLGAYGESKLEGEHAVRREAGELASIVRTAWVYGPGGRNFVRTMLRLLQERPSLSVVSDQLGSPTHTHNLAQFILHLARHGQGGGQTLHWTDAGVASWYDLAQMTRLLACRRWPERTWGEILPTDTAGYPTPAQRPRFSVLDTRASTALTGLQPPSWMRALETAILNDHERLWLPSD